MLKASLGSLYCFDAVVRHGGLGKAAAAMHLTHGAVSHQVKALEESLNVKLFERQGRGLKLTRAGHKLSRSTQQCFDLLATALADVQVASDAPLVVSCEPTIAMKWLIPQLSDFYARFPQIGIHLHTAGGPVDFERQRIDIALRRNDFAWDAKLVAEKLCDEWIAPVCAPALRRADGSIDFSENRLLHTLRRPSAWNDWSSQAGHPVKSARHEEFEHFHLSLQAAEASLGVAIGSLFMVHEEVRSGRLVAPYGYVRDGSSYFVLHKEEAASDAARVQREIFHLWLKERMNATLSTVDLAGAPPGS